MAGSCYRGNVAEKTGQERAQEGSWKNKNHTWKSCLTADSMRRSHVLLKAWPENENSERFWSMPETKTGTVDCVGKEGGTRNGAFYCRGPYRDSYLRGGDAGEVRRMVRTQASGG